MSTFGTRLGDVLDKCGCTQSDLGRRLGMNVNQINHFINGRREPSLENLALLLKELWWVDARWLVTGVKATDIRGNPVKWGKS